MSEITLFKGGNVAIPDYIKNVESKLKDLTFAGSSGRNISIRGSVWRMIVDGKEVAKSDERAIKVVIVGMSEAVGRTFYEGSYEEGKESAPVCWSADGKMPDMRSEKPQASNCDDCPKNIGGSGQGDSKACRYMRNLAVVMANDMGGDIYKLSLPAMSLFGAAEGKKMPLDAYRRFLKGHGIPLDCVVTEMRFDTDSSTPKVIFSAVSPLEKEEFDICQERASSQEATQAVTIEFAGSTKTETKKAEAKPKATAKPKVEETGPEEPEEEPAPKAKADNGFKPSKPDNGFTPVEKVEAEEVDDEPQPKRRASKKAETVSSTPDVASVLGKWADDDEDE